MLFKKLKQSKTFADWLDGILKELDVDAKAFNVNIYENKKGYSAELVATASFDEDDEDWACDEIYASRNDNNEFEFKAKNWESALDYIKSSLNEYLQNGKFADILKNSQAVAYGFVDGDLTVIYNK